jgi:hypothetical protein
VKSLPASSAATQNEGVAHVTTSKVLYSSISVAVDHEVPLKLSALPDESTAAQKVELVQATYSAFEPSMCEGVAHEPEYLTA